MIRLTENQLQQEEDWIKQYIEADNAADASTVDSNANVTNKNIVTLEAELHKGINIQINRRLIKNKIEELFGKDLSEQYIKDLESHLIYTHDESSLKPYCVALNMYPFLLNGMKVFNDEEASEAPKHLRSFCGGYVNLIQYVAANFAGAVATVEFLMYFDYFARKDYGDDYLETSMEKVDQELQGVIYLLNQASTARGGQSVFSNISTFDKYFFEGVFGEFVFPDLTKPNWESLDRLQQHWHIWFREERKKKLLTFPVVTHCAITENGNDWRDRESKDFIANEMAEGGEFFIYTSSSADSLASCCRLRNEVTENDFSYSLGAGGVATGSKNVITLNLNRMTQTGIELDDITRRIQKYQVAFNEHFRIWQEKGLLPVYDAELITLDKQFSTIGINGLVESAEFLGYEISNNEKYTDYIVSIVGRIKELNKIAAKEYNCKFNTEVVPAENLGVKNAKWDKKDGLKVNRDCYNSYFYIVENDDNLFDKLELHGGKVLDNLDGGSAVHWNSDERLGKAQYTKILESLVITGSNYFCENVKKTCCNSCGTITANTFERCPKCGSEDIDYATRVIGYLKKIKHFSGERQTEEGDRTYQSK